MPRRLRSLAAGQSFVELTASLIVLPMLLVLGADFARLFYTYVGVIDAARATAQYGSHDVVSAANLTQSSSAAQTVGQQATPTIANLTVTASECTCGTATSAVPACSSGSSYCTDDPEANYVIVNASAPFSTIVKYPGLPSSLTLSSQAVMQIEQQ